MRGRTFAAAGLSLALAATAALAALAAEMTPRPTALDRLKALAGEWEAKGEDGAVLTKTTYEVVAAGNSVMETIQFPDGNSMVTLYHHDGDRLMLTHFCMAGNQPRLVAKDPGPKATELTFSFLDATNLRAPDESHLYGVTFAFQDAGHFKQNMIFKEGGVEAPMAVTYTRTK